MYFDELNLDDRLLDALYEMRFDQCTPIQEKAIPPLLEGRDLVGIAQTGTGKTAAYLLPILNRLSTGSYPEGNINCLIMVPTRELAMQIDQALEAFSYHLPFSGVAVYGGNDGIRYEQELRGMKRGADIIVATPGRLISHLQLGNVDLSHVSFFVLDEADRMLDMGFHDDIMKIASYLPADRQTLLFSATMPDDIQRLANNLLHQPVHVRIAVSKPAEGIDHKAYICYEPQKMRILEAELKSIDLKKAVMFVSKKTKVKDLTLKMRKMGLKMAQMHSDLTQEERNRVMQDFKTGRINLIVATDIISRGIDIDDIQLVINYDVPHDAEDYIHRIGRTARAGKEGRAITLVSEDDQYYFGKIEKFLGTEIPKLPLPEDLNETPTYNPDRGRERSVRGRRRRAGIKETRERSANPDKHPQGKKPSRYGSRRKRGGGKKQKHSADTRNRQRRKKTTP